MWAGVQLDFPVQLYPLRNRKESRRCLDLLRSSMASVRARQRSLTASSMTGGILTGTRSPFLKSLAIFRASSLSVFTDSLGLRVVFDGAQRIQFTPKLIR